MAVLSMKRNNMPGQGKLECNGVRKLLFSSSSFLFLRFRTLELLWFIALFIPLPLTPFQQALAASRDRNIYSSRRPLRQSCLCYTEESPLCVSQLSINLKPFLLLSKTIITYHDSVSVPNSGSLSPPVPPRPSSQLML